MRLLRFAAWLLFSLTVIAFPAGSNAQVICVSNVSPPPELPVYDQPPIPAAGYLWIPGYWGSGPNGYFWVPGTWVQPPSVGLLWTPGYWGWRDGIYVWNAGYWGPHVGFYGGINYGFGYGGVGYEGGRWENGAFAYNRAVNNFGGVTIVNVYEKTVVVEPGALRVSFQGGSGGTTARPTPAQEAAAHEQHVAAIPAQLAHERTASADKALLASENHGRPAVAATAKPGEFTGKGVVAATEERPAGATPGPKPGGVGPNGPNANVPALERKGPEGNALPKSGERTPAANVEGKPNIESKPNVEGKPSVAGKPPGTEPKANVEAKPNAETKPNAQTKPPGEQPRANVEAKPPGGGPKPETNKPENKPETNKPELNRAAEGKPGPGAPPKPHPGPEAKPGAKDKKPE